MARHGENIYKRKDGRYVVGKKLNGKTKFGYVFGRQYGEVKARLLEKKAELLTYADPCVRRNGKTIEQWMRYWMENELQSRVKASSYQTYQNLLHKHLLPRLGKIGLVDLTTAAVHILLQELRESGLSESMVRNVYRLLSAGMRATLDGPCSKFSVNERCSARLCLREIRDIMTLSQQRGCCHGEITASA